MTTAPAPEAITFRAEIRQLLNILIHSLYTDREIFPARADLQRLRRAQPAAVRDAHRSRRARSRCRTGHPHQRRPRKPHPDHQRHRRRHDPRRDDRKPGHHRALGRGEFLAVAAGRPEAGRRDRAVWGRFLFRVHGGGRGQGHQPVTPARRHRLDLDRRRRRQLLHRAGRENRARHHDHGQAQGRSQGIQRSPTACATSSTSTPTLYRSPFTWATTPSR